MTMVVNRLGVKLLMWCLFLDVEDATGVVSATGAEFVIAVLGTTVLSTGTLSTGVLTIDVDTEEP